jgi:hypothetical protein
MKKKTIRFIRQNFIWVPVIGILPRIKKGKIVTLTGTEFVWHATWCFLLMAFVLIFLCVIAYCLFQG